MREGVPTMSADMDSLHPNESYKGSENTIQKKTFHQAEFICSFENITSYPFDDQNCYIQFYISGTDNELTNLKHGVLETKGTAQPSSTVGHYAVRKWTISTGPNGGGGNSLILTVQLGRNIGSVFLVTYVPTILMNIINQATNYAMVNGNNYEIIMTINITSMMVLASIYLSVSSSLPATASIKPIEIWLLFNLVYPFIIIMVNIILQVK